MALDRRNFLGRILTAAAGFSILPAATTYKRIWTPEKVIEFPYDGRQFWGQWYMSWVPTVTVPPVAPIQDKVVLWKDRLWVGATRKQPGSWRWEGSDLLVTPEKTINEWAVLEPKSILHSVNEEGQYINLPNPNWKNHSVVKALRSYAV